MLRPEKKQRQNLGFFPVQTSFFFLIRRSLLFKSIYLFLISFLNVPLHKTMFGIWYIYLRLKGTQALISQHEIEKTK